MIITNAALSAVFTGYKAAFAKGFEGAAPAWDKVAMKVPSNTEKEAYGWLRQFPKMREWLGDRIINSLIAEGQTIVNKDFESTIGVPRNKIQDDVYGLFTPMFEEMGKMAAEHPDKLVYGLLSKGWSTFCYDGQYFFDADHPVGLNGLTPVRTVANTDGGTGEPWYLIDNSRAFKPLIFQERAAPDFISKDQPDSDNVFLRKEYVYGTDCRGAAGFGLWQLAWGSKQPLDVARYEAGRKFLQTQIGDAGRPLGVKPTTLIVGPNNEAAALALINAATLANGETNKWHNTVEVVVTQWAQSDLLPA